MVTFEQVEKLREYANVSYDEAKEALENAGGDMLQAVIDLERQGKTGTPQGGGKVFAGNVQDQDYTSQGHSGNGKNGSKTHGQNHSSLGETFQKIVRWIGKIIHKGNINALVVERRGEQMIKLPVTALVVLLFCAFWVMVPLFIVGLFFGFRYSFSGPDLGTDTVNDALKSASNAAEEIKRDMQK